MKKGWHQRKHQRSKPKNPGKYTAGSGSKTKNFKIGDKLVNDRGEIVTLVKRSKDANFPIVKDSKGKENRIYAGNYKLLSAKKEKTEFVDANGTPLKIGDKVNILNEKSGTYFIRSYSFNYLEGVYDIGLKAGIDATSYARGGAWNTEVVKVGHMQKNLEIKDRNGRIITQDDVDMLGLGIKNSPLIELNGKVYEIYIINEFDKSVQLFEIESIEYDSGNKSKPFIATGDTKFVSRKELAKSKLLVGSDLKKFLDFLKSKKSNIVVNMSTIMRELKSKSKKVNDGNFRLVGGTWDYFYIIPNKYKLEILKLLGKPGYEGFKCKDDTDIFDTLELIEKYVIKKYKSKSDESAIVIGNSIVVPVREPSGKTSGFNKLVAYLPKSLEEKYYDALVSDDDKLVYDFIKDNATKIEIVDIFDDTPM